MEPKRELSSVDIAAVVGELRGYEGAVVDKAYLYGDDLVRLKLRHHDHGRVELLVEVGDTKRAHVADPERVPAAPERPPDFARKLRSRLAGGNLASVEQYEFDRILVAEFEREDADTTVVAELFGDGNVAVLDETGAVVDSLRTVRLQSRTVAPGAQYEYPASRVNPLDVDYDTFAALMDDSDTDVVRTLATQLNFGGLYAEEVCARAGVEKALAIGDAGDDEYRRLHDAVGRLAERLRTGDLDPRLYVEDDRPVDATPFPLEERAGLDSEAFETFDGALDEYFHRLAAVDREPDRPDFEARIEKHQRIVAQQEEAIEEFAEEADREREKAELLYANYDLVDEVISAVREAREAGSDWAAIRETLAEGAERGIPAAEAVVDVDPDGGTVTVALDDTEVPVDPSMGVEKNADRRYQEAKRVEDKRDGAEEALEESRAELETIREERDAWDEDGEGGQAGEGRADAGAGGGDRADAGASERTPEEWLAEPSIPVRQPEHWYERFRWFHTSDGFLVVGGRDADQNEALVSKYLEPGDLFVHAQAHGGPATVLKATGPSEPARDVDVPESSREEAARFAVSYSSVWKDGRFSGDAYLVGHDQVSKTPESGEYLEKGAFAVRGDRTYYRDVAVGVAVGVAVEPETRVVGGPPSAIEEQVATAVRVEPGQFAQADVGKRIYRAFRERFADTSFVRKVASPDRIQHFLPPGGSRIVEE